MTWVFSYEDAEDRVWIRADGHVRFAHASQDLAILVRYASRLDPDARFLLRDVPDGLHSRILGACSTMGFQCEFDCVNSR